MLKEYTGKVDRIIDDVAYLTMWSGEETVHAEIHAHEMAKQDINEGDRFKLIIGDGITIERVPFCPPDAAKMAQIDAELAEAFPDSILKEDELE